MGDWLDTLQGLGARRTPCVLVTVARVRGSTPREAGAKMVVTADAVLGTVGGGNLEFKATDLAREMLAAGARSPLAGLLRHFPLGPSLGQCCGGAATLHLERVPGEQPVWVERLAAARAEGACVLVSAAGGETPAARKLLVSEEGEWGSLGAVSLDAQARDDARELLALARPGAAGDRCRLRGERPGAPALLLECFTACDFHIVLFGAGHVGKAVAAVLQGLPCRITWVDSRGELFPAGLPGNVTVEASERPAHAVERAPPQAFFLVMSHSHDLDFALIERILRRGDFRYLGLIGSLSKRRRFEKRLLRRGFTPAALGRLTCPIGVAGISGKHPAAIAVAVAAEILQIQEGATSVATAPADTAVEPAG